jgi:hypothetical protein
MDPQTGLGALENRKVSCLCRKSKHGSLGGQTVTWLLYRLSWTETSTHTCLRITGNAVIIAENDPVARVAVLWRRPVHIYVRLDVILT